MKLSLVSGPQSEPLTVDDVKAQSRIDISDDDALILNYIEAAREFIERDYLSCALITQTWDLYLDDWPAGDSLYLPRPPLQSVTSVTYTDEDGSSATFSSSSYLVDTVGKPGRIVLKTDYSWPSTTLQEVNGLVVRFVAGYGDDADDVPARIRQALRLLVADFYENRENAIVAQGITVEQVPFGVKQLLASLNLRSEKVL